MQLQKTSRYFNYVFLLLSLVLCACTGTAPTDNGSTETSSDLNQANQAADVTAVTISGDAGNYSFSVTVRSPDTGCDQYADWWEVLSADGNLIYRRILAHSHVSEQPFARSGGPINVLANEAIVVRAHMNNLGYGTQVFSGSAEAGLMPTSAAATFAEDLAFVDPLPASCAF